MRVTWTSVQIIKTESVTFDYVYFICVFVIVRRVKWNMLVMVGSSSGRADYGEGLRPIACLDCGFESRRRHGCLVCCEWCMLSGRGLCDELIPRPEEFYRLWCVIACDLETSIMRLPWPALGCCARGNAMIMIGKFSKNWIHNLFYG